MIFDILSARGVKRFHTLPFIGEQTIADHSWGVAVIVAHLAQGRDPSRVLAMVLEALYHDVPERWVGDTPGDIKATDRAIHDALGDAERRVVDTLFGGPIPLTPEEAATVKMADSLDLIWVAGRQGMLGNTYLAQASACAGKTVDLLLSRFPNPWAADMRRALLTKAANV